MLKICLMGDVASAFFGYPPGGAEKQLGLIVKGLSEYGHSVTVIDTSIKEDIMVDQKILFVSLSKRVGTNSFLKMWEIYKLIISLRPDVYYMRLRSIWHLGAYFAVRKNKSVFVSGLSHDTDAKKFRERFKVQYSEYNWKKVLKQIIHTELVFTYLLKKSKIVFAQHNGQIEDLKKNNISSVHCPNIFETVKPKDVRPKFKSYFVFLGSLSKRKGIDHIKYLTCKVGNKNFVIIGKIKDDYTRNIISEITNLPNVEFKDQMSNREALGWVKKSDAVISVSKMEGYPNIFLESFSLGTPVISLESNPDCILSHFQFGIYCEGCNKKLKGAVREFEKYKFKNKEMKSYVKENHNIDKTTSIITKEVLNKVQYK